MPLVQVGMPLALAVILLAQVSIQAVTLLVQADTQLAQVGTQLALEDNMFLVVIPLEVTLFPAEWRPAATWRLELSRGQEVIWCQGVTQWQAARED